MKQKEKYNRSKRGDKGKEKKNQEKKRVEEGHVLINLSKKKET